MASEFEKFGVGGLLIFNARCALGAVGESNAPVRGLFQDALTVLVLRLEDEPHAWDARLELLFAMRIDYLKIRKVSLVPLFIPLVGILLQTRLMIDA